MDRAKELERVTEISDKHCSICPVNSNSYLKQCQECPYFHEMRIVGEKLLEDTRKKRKKKGVPVNVGASRKADFNSKGKLVPKELSKESYVRCKDLGMRDLDVALYHNVSRHRIAVFKRENGLITRYGSRK